MQDDDSIISPIENWLRQCVVQAARESSFERYQLRTAALVPVHLPEWTAMESAAGASQMMMGAVARAVWVRCPHPALDFALPRLPELSRNAPCHCRSGRKYKHCCLELDRAVPVTEMNLLPMLVDELPKSRWPDMAGSRVPLAMLINLAHTWQEERRFEDLRALLAPWFADSRHFTERHEPLLDCLLDCYDALNNPKKKQALLERALRHGDRATISSIHQRLASIAQDRGDTASAWQHFQQAQRLNPESPSLCHLELILLLAQGQEAQARSRARFWVQALRRRRDPGLDDLIGFAEQIAEHGAPAMGRFMAGMDPLLAALQEAVGQMPEIEVHYRLPHKAKSRGSAGPLQASATLESPLAEWQASRPDEARPGSVPQSLQILRRHPRLWHCFEVLEDLVGMTSHYPAVGTDQSILLPLLERSSRLLRAVLSSEGAEGLGFEWGWLANRPALRLIAKLAGLELEHDPLSEPARDLLRWSIDTLNPNDNLGLRMPLLAVLLRRGELPEAVALADRYPDDLPEMQYLAALARHLAGQAGAAADGLSRAMASYPKIAKYLLAEAPPQPKLDPHGVLLGGNDEAWLFRAAHLDLWQRSGGLQWLRQMVKASARRAPRTPRRKA